MCAHVHVIIPLISFSDYYAGTRSHSKSVTDIYIQENLQFLKDLGVAYTYISKKQRNKGNTTTYPPTGKCHYTPSTPSHHINNLGIVGPISRLVRNLWISNLCSAILKCTEHIYKRGRAHSRISCLSLRRLAIRKYYSHFQAFNNKCWLAKG